jgi:hypothetical protein
MISMGDAVAHMQISAETICDSAQRIRRLAHELLELVRLRDKVRRAEARQKARGKFGPRDRRKRVRHVLKIRYRWSGPIVPNRFWPPQQSAFIESFSGRLRWIGTSVAACAGLKCVFDAGHQGEFRCLASDRLLETIDGSHLLSALTVQPGRASNDNSAGRIRRTTNVLCSFGAMVKFKTVIV